MEGTSYEKNQIVQQPHTTEGDRNYNHLKTYYQTIFENTGTAMGVFDEDCVIKSVNHAFEELTGYKKSEVENQLHWYDFVAEEDLKRMQEYHQQRNNDSGNPPEEYNCCLITRSGEQRTVHIRLAIVPETKERIVSLLDISKTQQLEKEKTLILDSMNEMFCFYSTDLKILWANKASAQSVGKPLDDIIGKYCYSLWNQSDQPCDDCPVLKALDTGKPQTIEKQTPDGRYWQISGYPVLDSQGQVKNLVELGLDITEKKKTEEKFQKLFENSPFGIGYYDLQGNILSFNKKACQNLGRENEIFSGKHCSEIFDEHWAKKIQQRIDIAKESKTTQFYEDCFTFGNERKKYFISGYSAIYDCGGRVDGVQIVSNDVTEQKNAQNLLQNTQQRYENLVNTINSGVCIYQVKNDGRSGEDYIIKDFNNFALEHEKMKKEEVIGKSLKDIRPNIDSFGLIDIFRKVWVTGEPAFYPAKIYQDEKFSNYYENRVFRLSPSEIVAIYDDVTNRKLAEEKVVKNEEKYRTLFENMKQGVFYQRADGKLIDANQSVLDMFGISKEEFLLRTSESQQWSVVNEQEEELKAEEHPSMVALSTGKPCLNNILGVYNQKKERYNWLIVNAMPQFKDGEAHPYQVFVTLHDITDLKNLEEQKRIQEEQFKSLFLSMTEGVCLHEIIRDSSAEVIDYRILDVNPSFEQILNLDKKEVKGKLATEAYKTTTPPFLDRYQKVVETGEPCLFQEYFEPMDRYFNISAFSMGTDRFATAFIDVTDQVKSQEIIQESEKKFSTIFNKVTVGILAIDTQTNDIVFSNPEIEKITGYRSDELATMNVSDLHRQEDMPYVLDKIEKQIKGEIKDAAEIPVLTKQGNIRYCDIRSTKETISGKGILLGILNDITEKKNAEDQVKKSQEKYRTYVDNSPDGIFVANRQGEYLEVNKAAAKITGYSKEELLQKSIADMAAPESKQQAMEHFKRLLETGLTTGDNIFIHKDGTRRWWNIDAVKLTEDRYIGFTQDITHRKTIEAELKKKNKELETLNQLKSNFLNVTSHELRTPMTAINGYLQMLQENTLGEINSEQKDAIEVILRNADRLDRLVDDILDTSRLESGTMKFIPQETELPTLIDEVQQTMQKEASCKKITIEKTVQDNLPTLTIDQDRIKQVFQNLIKNSIKFSDAHTTITLEAQENNESILFKVTDQGRGIPADQQQCIFDIFYQVESGIDRSFGGTGLGLTICRGIIIGHGGNIWVESKEGAGSTFYFTLPKHPISDVEGTFEKIDVFNLKDKTRKTP